MNPSHEREDNLYPGAGCRPLGLEDIARSQVAHRSHLPDQLGCGTKAAAALAQALRWLSRKERPACDQTLHKLSHGIDHRIEILFLVQSHSIPKRSCGVGARSPEPAVPG